MARRRIGLFGGSFNPVHFGHLRTAEEVREQAALDELWLVLASEPPHKRPGEVADAADRLRMLELATARAPGMRIETAELERPGPSYTIDTLHTLRRCHPEVDFSAILGQDAFREIDSWHRFEELLGECDWIITSRPPVVATSGAAALTVLGAPIAVTRAFWYEPEQKCYRHRSGRRLDVLPVTGLDISASELRALVRAGRSIRFLTDPDVIDYIAARGLYRSAVRL